MTCSIRHFHRHFHERHSRGTSCLDQLPRVPLQATSMRDTLAVHLALTSSREFLSRSRRTGHLQRSATDADPRSSSLRTSPPHPWSHLLKAGIHSSHQTNPKGVSPRALFPTNSSSKRHPLESPGEFLSGVPPCLERKNSFNASGVNIGAETREVGLSCRTSRKHDP